MTIKKIVEQLPEPSTAEEMLIYNFLVGKEVYAVSPFKAKDRYLQALLLCLGEKFKQAAAPVKKKATTKE